MRFLPFLAVVLLGCPQSTEPPNSLGVTALFEGERLLPIEAGLRFTLEDVEAGDVEVSIDPEVALATSWDPVDGVLTAWPEGGLQAIAAYDVTVTTPDGAVVFPVHTTGELVSPNGSDSWCDEGECARVSIEARETAARSYRLQTDHPLRDNNPASGEVSFLEQPGQPVLRSGHDLFDALFAMSVHEARQLSVDFIQDGAFAGGAPIACDCFQTGELWHYVWTRDTAYAVDLGLAWLDPARSRNSLDFKLSTGRDGGPLQIVQDTGTGGSWPVSTDRVVWAIGAARTLDFLEEPARGVFAERAREAMATTAERDREAVYNVDRGVYTGEQSFLDWREQSYPSWVEGDVVHIGMSEALSTNAGHLAMLQLLTELSEEAGMTEDAGRYGAWADELEQGIQDVFWNEGAYTTLTTNTLDRAPVHRWDLLGTALASATLDDDTRTRDALAAYPHADHGPPVQWPQLPDIPVYHNRSIWPFVSAYGLREARRHDLAEHVTHDVLGMVRSSALNVSNMENLEFVSGDNWWDDGELSGPVVNSRRQLWSVAGYLSMVVDTMLGMESSQDGVSFSPYIPGTLRDELLGNVDRLVLRSFPYKGHTVDIEVRLPLAGQEHSAASEVQSVVLNGEVLSDGLVRPSLLQDGDNRLVITLVASDAATTTPVLVDSNTPGNALFAPTEPLLDDVSAQGGGRRLNWSGDQGAVFTVYRDGERLVEALAAGEYLDSEDVGDASPCYVVEAMWPETGLRSHHSPARCFWGPNIEGRVQVLSAATFSSNAGSLTQSDGRSYYSDWGAPGDELTVSLTANRTGPHLLSFGYANGALGFDSGVTAAVKRVAVSGIVGEKWVVMPHTASWDNWKESSFVSFDLVAGQDYIVTVSDGANMSYLEHFARYSGTGGATPFNNVDISQMVVLSR